MPSYASGKYANAYCDICGKPVKYRDLRDHVYNQMKDGLRVCSECDDRDNPQLQVGRYFRAEPQALLNPRPDSAELAVSRAFVGFNPVVSLVIRTAIGTVTVTT